MELGNIGSSLDDLLRADGIYEQTSATAIKRVLARRIFRETTAQKIVEERNFKVGKHKPPET